MEKIATFGSIFSFDNADYVFLAYSVPNDMLYAAKILDPETSQELIRDRARDDKNCDYNPKREVVYCFVVLTTADFEGRAAHFGTTIRNEVKISTIHAELNESDEAALRGAVLGSSVAPTLKELLESTT